MTHRLFTTLTLAALMTFGVACKAPAPEAPALPKTKEVNPGELRKNLKLAPKLKSVKVPSETGKTKTSREEKAAQVRKTYAEKGLFPAVKEYRTLMKSTLAEAAFFVDLEKELKGEPSLEAVRKAVMSDKPQIALSEAMRISKDKAKAQKKVDDFKVILIPVTLQHAKDIQKRDKRSAFSMAHRLFPNTPVWELEAKLK